MSTTNNPVKIGDIGPGGGIVFYLDSTGFRGLEARPATEVHSMAWPAAADFVASLVRTLGPGWRMPTIEELKLLYKEKEIVGGFDRSYFHWSSTEFNRDNALSLVDKTGDEYPLRKLGDACYVRPIRAFGPDDTIRETNPSAIKIEPHESIIWSTHWEYNYDQKFSQNEKDEILESVKTTSLTPHPTISNGFTLDNNKFSIFVYLVKGAWEINGADRK